ncbi:MAG: hypothetical protein QM658_16595 [Gordonia sp. (in: high G+C Gram-positive bacteria)]
MTHPGTGAHDEPPRLPTQAELDAEDLAEIARNVERTDIIGRYPRPEDDPGPAPAMLTRGAFGFWAIGAVLWAACFAYGMGTLGSIVDKLRARLQPQMEGIDDVDAAAQSHSMGGFFPPALLIGLMVAILVSGLLLRGVAKHHSRNLRSIYAAVVVIIMLFVPACSDLLFNYPDTSAIWRILMWATFGALGLSVVASFAPSVSRWLPASMRVKPMRVVRGR